MKLEENKFKEQKKNNLKMTFFLKKKYWHGNIMKWLGSTHVNMLYLRPGSWDHDNHEKIKFEQINKKKIHYEDKFKINQMFFKTNSIWHIKKNLVLFFLFLQWMNDRRRVVCGLQNPTNKRSPKNQGFVFAKKLIFIQNT
jgi:hypothetical protein